MNRRGERGQVGGIEVLPFGLLVFVAGTLLMTSIWGVVDARFAAASAAREGARWVVERASDDRSTADVRSGVEAVAAAAIDGRATPDAVEVTSTGGFGRCARVRVRVVLTVPVVRIPFVGAYGDGVEVSASHTELVDPTRSGVGGRATCIR